MSNLTVKEVEAILRETSQIVREKLQPLADAGFNDFDVNIKCFHTVYMNAKNTILDVEVTAKLNN